MNPEKSDQRYRELDALRGIAALSTVFFHFTLGRPEADYGFELGVTGVDLFFIISGFVIFMTINKVSSTLEFAVNRFARLYPTYWACVTLTFLLMIAVAFIAHKSHPSFYQYAANMTMFQFYFGVQDLDGPYWTMLVEMLFYICIGLLNSFGRIKYVLPIGLAVVGTTIVMDLAMEFWYPALQKVHDYFPLITHFPLFLSGIIFYKLMNEVEGKSEKPFLYSALAVCFGAALLLYDNGGKSVHFINFGQYFCCLALYFLVFILFVNNKLGFVVNRVTLFLGRISFPLYLIQLYISINFVIPGLMKYAGFGFWPACLGALAVLLVISAGINYFVEVPMNKRLKGWFRRKLGFRRRPAGV